MSLVIAGKSGSNEDKKWFANLNHPDNAFLLKIMNILGVIIYLFFGIVLYNLIINSEIIPIVLMVIMITLNGLSPYLKYKLKNLQLFFLILLSFPVLAVGVIVFLIPSNFTLAIPVIIFALWFIYDLSYYYRMIKLSKHEENIQRISPQYDFGFDRMDF